MTEPDERYSEEMRRALAAAADLVVPAGDALDKIRERIVHRPAPFAWFVAYTQDLPHRIFVSFRVVATSVTGTGGGGSSGAHPGSLDERRRPHFNRESSWVRPTLAAVGALAIVAIAATLILPRLNQPVATSGFNRNPLGQSVSPAAGTSSRSSSQQNSSSGQPLTSKSPRSLITMPPPPSQCQTLPPSSTSSMSTSSSPSPTNTATTYISPTPAPGPSETATPTPNAAPQSFANMIGEEAVQAASQQAAAATTCATQPPTSQPAPPPTSPTPTSAPPTSTPPTSTPPTSTPATTPPPTSGPTNIPSPEGSVTPTVAPPLP